VWRGGRCAVALQDLPGRAARRKVTRGRQICKWLHDFDVHENPGEARARNQRAQGPFPRPGPPRLAKERENEDWGAWSAARVRSEDGKVLATAGDGNLGRPCRATGQFAGVGCQQEESEAVEKGRVVTTGSGNSWDRRQGHHRSDGDRGPFKLKPNLLWLLSPG
jgi:hypothetical protein